MSRFEDRIAAPPALPPIRPPRGRGGEPDKTPGEPPLWERRPRFGVIERVGIKFPARKGDRRLFYAKSLPLTTCVVLKVVPPGARRSAAALSPIGYYKGWAAIPRPKRKLRFKTKAEKRRGLRWLHGFTRETEYFLHAPHCFTFGRAREMLLKTRWSIKLKLKMVS